MEDIQKGKGTRSGTWKLILLLISTSLVSLCLDRPSSSNCSKRQWISNRYEDGRERMRAGEV